MAKKHKQWLMHVPGPGQHCFQCELEITKDLHGWIGRPEVFCSERCRDIYRARLPSPSRPVVEGLESRRGRK